MDRRKFLKGIGIGAATLAIAPQILSNDAIGNEIVPKYPGINGTPFKVQLGVQPPFIWGAFYYSKSRRTAYAAINPNQLVRLNSKGNAIIVHSYPKDLQLVGSAHSEF